MKRQKINVVDKGHVTLVDYMGDDSSIVQAARVSTGGGTKTAEKDRQLIRYMMQHRHTSVFEQVIFKFHVKAPIFVIRQWHRHRTWSYNEQSGRYSELSNECYIPQEDRLQPQSSINKQGSEGWIDQELIHPILCQMADDQHDMKASYQYYLESISRELARINLPLSTYTEMYATVDLHNLFHFLKLRLDSHAQYEIRVYAEAIYELIKPVVPIACEAFEDYVLNAKTFSAQEMSVIANLLNAKYQIDSDDPDKDNVPWNKAINVDLSKRELEEFKKKLGI